MKNFLLKILFILLPFTMVAQFEDPPKMDEGSEMFTSAATVEVKPEYPGGLAKFYKFLTDNFKSPAVEDDITAKVYLSFIVEKDGSMTNINVVRDPGYGLGDEAVRVLKLIPEKWKPGYQSGEAVRCSYNLPMTINLPGSNKKKKN